MESCPHLEQGSQEVGLWGKEEVLSIGGSKKIHCLEKKGLKSQEYPDSEPRSGIPN